MKKIKARFYKSPRLEIVRILTEELTNWESTDKVNDEEFYRLVDRLAKLTIHDKKK